MKRLRDEKKLKEIALKLRRDIIEMIYRAGSGHPGGSLSAVEVVSALYLGEMNYDPHNIKDPDRDRFILSKGHCCPVLYATLAHVGAIPREELWKLRKLGSPLQGHPCMLKMPQMELSTGSLGQGLSAGIGMALAARIDKRDYRVYVLLGDGECQEGETWEAAMTAGHHKVDNLCAIVDYNHVQQTHPIAETKDLEPLVDKWRAFNWHALKIDGNSYPEIFRALDEARATKGKPTCIIADTQKGKGVSFMEGDPGFHGKAPSDEQYVKAMAELGVDTSGGKTYE
ncbi:MAG TPA: transketolase [Planctomycetota bacterium]|nr:transketolase [Planctomycetota bacterium]